MILSKIKSINKPIWVDSKKKWYKAASEIMKADCIAVERGRPESVISAMLHLPAAIASAA